nr:hypothetical protein [Algoriphagus sp.]
MINKKEMNQVDLQASHTSVRKMNSKGKQGNRITGSIFRECLTTITRV